MLRAGVFPWVGIGRMRADGGAGHRVRGRTPREEDGTNIGTVRVYQETTGVVLRVDAHGLPPGQHGVHLHAVGSCEGPKFTSAGAHWNPTAKQARPPQPERIPLGRSRQSRRRSGRNADRGLLVPGARLRTDGDGDGPVLRDADGAALVVHATADDEKTDPSGNSGDRIACAVL